MNLSRQDQWDRYVEEDMFNRRTKAIQTISKMTGMKHAEDFANILAYSWRDSLTEAERLAKELDLDYRDFTAIEMNDEMYSDILWEERVLYGNV